MPLQVECAVSMASLPLRIASSLLLKSLILAAPLWWSFSGTGRRSSLRAVGLARRRGSGGRFGRRGRAQLGSGGQHVQQRGRRLLGGRRRVPELLRGL